MKDIEFVIRKFSQRLMKRKYGKISGRSPVRNLWNNDQAFHISRSWHLSTSWGTSWESPLKTLYITVIWCWGVQGVPLIGPLLRWKASKNRRLVWNFSARRERASSVASANSGTGKTSRRANTREPTDKNHPPTDKNHPSTDKNHPPTDKNHPPLC